MTDETILKIGDLIFPVGAARGISQTIQPIDNGDVRRTVNGSLLDLTRIQNRKFESQIRLQDQATPTLAGVWKGSTHIIECIFPFRELVDPASTTHTIIRTPVTGSVTGIEDISGLIVDPISVVGEDITFTNAVNLIKYRPVLTMMVLAITFDVDEYAATEGWTVDFEEV